MAVMRRVTAACRHLLVFPTPVSDQADMEDATRALTGLSSCSLWLLTNWAADVALVRTGGGLGGCRGAWATGDVAFTYSDRSISSCGTQEPTSQTREELVISDGVNTAATRRRETQDDVAKRNTLGEQGGKMFNDI